MKKYILHSKKRMLLLTIFLAGFMGTFQTAFGQLKFSDPVVYSAPGQPDDVVIADFTGDGKPDIATMNLQNNQILLFVNSGLQSFEPQKVIITVYYPISIGAGDFNGDGRQDIAVTDYTGTLRIFLNDGSGDFIFSNSPITGDLWSPHAFYIITADFNNDNITDIAVGTGDNSIYLQLGNGDGTFTNGGMLYFAGANAVLTVGDFNGDGRTDIATIVSDNALLSVLINTGNGSFAPFVTYPVGQLPNKIIVGDFNGDGKQDIATGSDIRNVSVLFNKGDGTFQPAVSIPIFPNVLTTADYNHDGIADIVAGGFNDPLVTFLGSKSGVFTTAASSRPNVEGPSKSVDLNGDSWPDIVICNSDGDNITVTYNFSQPCPRPVISASGPTSFCTGDSVTLSAPDSASYLWSTGATTRSIVVKSAGGYSVTTNAAGGCIALHSDTIFVKMNLCDADGDGIPDAQDCDPMDPNNNKVSVCHNGHTICVSRDAVKAHLKHGDYLGNCTGGCDTPSSPVTLEVYPNPNNGHFTVAVNSPGASRGELQIVDMKGNIIERRQVQMAKGMQTFQFHLSKKASGIYVVKLVDERSVRTFKIIFVH